MQLTVVSPSADDFEALYQRFLDANVAASFFYTRLWRQYQVAYSEDKLVHDLSVVVVDHTKKPVCICPLYLEEYDGFRQISFRGEYLKALRGPLVASDLHRKSAEQVLDYFFAHVDRLAAEHGATSVTFLIDPLCQAFEEERYNYLNRYGFVDCSMQTRLIDLTLSKEQLWMDLRRSYKPLINKALREFQCRIVDGRAAEDLDVAHAAYVDMHHRAAGRVTRPAETFELQKRQIEASHAFLTELSAGGRPVAYNFYGHTRSSAYYCSAADDPDFDTDLHLGHVLQWVSMLHLKEIGVKYLELDNQYFGDQLFEHPSEKEISISKFKAGFGGRNVPLFRGIRYYDAERFAQDMAGHVRASTDALRMRLSNRPPAVS